MGLSIKIPTVKAIEEKPAGMCAFQYLNELYGDQDLQFDEYGNLIYMPSDQQSEDD